MKLATDIDLDPKHSFCALAIYLDTYFKLQFKAVLGNL
jgi:hypothetical protein